MIFGGYLIAQHWNDDLWNAKMESFAERIVSVFEKKLLLERSSTLNDELSLFLPSMENGQVDHLQDGQLFLIKIFWLRSD